MGARAREAGARAREAIDASVGSAWRGARELLLDNPVNRFVTRVALVEAIRRPGRLLGVGLALAALGWGLDTQTRVETDITKLVPQNLESLQNLNVLEHARAWAVQIDLMVSAKDLTKPATIEWMSSYESAVLKRFGYSATTGCGRRRDYVRPSRCRTSSRVPPRPHRRTRQSSRRAEVQGLLDAIPSYFSQDVISARSARGDAGVRHPADAAGQNSSG